MIWALIHIIDIMLWIIMACPVIYIMLFAIISLLPEKHGETHTDSRLNSFLILFPAYNEDNVILSSVRTFLKQDYPSEKYTIAVISDHMSNESNEALRALPISLFTPTFEHSSKAKAMQYAIARCAEHYDHIVILDADNIVAPDFLRRLNRSCSQGYKAIQCHRCAKNSDNDIAMLDGVSEEINNTIFRKVHNRIGLSSALIGSGMCFDYEWFRTNVNRLNTAGEDRELEALLLSQRIYIKYEEDIHVLDEKVSNKDNFQRQRLRWMSAQLHSLTAMLPNIPYAITTGNINYIDKTIQQMLIPRSILLVATLMLSVIMLIISVAWSVKWWILFSVLCLSMFTALPKRMRTLAILSRITALPELVLRMLNSIRKIDKSNKNFIHTIHDK